MASSNTTTLTVRVLPSPYMHNVLAAGRTRDELLLDGIYDLCRARRVEIGPWCRIDQASSGTGQTRDDLLDVLDGSQASSNFSPPVIASPAEESTGR